MSFRYAGDAGGDVTEAILLAGYKPINTRRAFRQAGRRDRTKGLGYGKLTEGQRERILRKNEVLNNALEREREAFGNTDIPQVDGVPTTLTDAEMDNRFNGLSKPPKRFDPKQDQIDYQRDVYRFSKKAEDAHFDTVMNSGYDLETRAGLTGYPTTLHNSLSTQEQDQLREVMRNHWDSKMMTINARLGRNDRLQGINRDGTFKIKNTKTGEIRNDSLQREGYGDFEMLAPEMYPGGKFGDFTNEELYRYNVEMFAPQIDPAAAVELIQPISPLDSEIRPAGAFPSL